MNVDVRADKFDIAELAQVERAARDTRQWAVMADCYYEESRVYLSWFDGTAAEFVAASRTMGEEPGGHATHVLGPTLVTVNGGRALADTSCVILMRRVFEGIECDLTSYCRHISRVEHDGGRWRLRSFVGVYEKNTLVPVLPGTVPAIDKQRLARHRPSYNFQCYYREGQGRVPFADRPGLDRPDLVEALLKADDAWLAGADVPLGVGHP
jgi:SnoaL-like domain